MIEASPSVSNETDTAGPPLAVTVAICTRNRCRFLKMAVESVLSQPRPEVELLVIDNASTDDTAAMAAEFARQHSWVRAEREEELGLSAARNTALRRARGQYVIFLDDDAIAEPDWLAAYAGLFAAPPVPQLAGAGGAVFPWYDVARPAWIHPDAHKLDWSDQPQPYKDRGAPWGCNFAVHRAKALELGGFNVQLGRKGTGMGAHEESDLFEKLKGAGWVFWWLPTARIKHHVAAQRLTFGGQWRGAFSEGSSAALYRLHLLPQGAERLLFRAWRLVTAPFQCLICLLAALVIAPFGRLHQATSLVCRAARSAGFGLRLLTGTGSSKEARAR